MARRMFQGQDHILAQDVLAQGLASQVLYDGASFHPWESSDVGKKIEDDSEFTSRTPVDRATRGR